jgi:hypothetical protein
MKITLKITTITLSINLKIITSNHEHALMIQAEQKQGNYYAKAETRT